MHVASAITTLVALELPGFSWPETAGGIMALLVGLALTFWIAARGLQSLGGSMNQAAGPTFWFFLAGLVAVCVYAMNAVG